MPKYYSFQIAGHYLYFTTPYDDMGLPYLSSVSDYKDDLKTIDELLSYEEEKEKTMF